MCSEGEIVAERYLEVQMCDEVNVYFYTIESIPLTVDERKFEELGTDIHPDAVIEMEV